MSFPKRFTFAFSLLTLEKQNEIQLQRNSARIRCTPVESAGPDNGGCPTPQAGYKKTSLLNELDSNLVILSENSFVM